MTAHLSFYEMIALFLKVFTLHDVFSVVAYQTYYVVKRKTIYLMTIPLASFMIKSPLHFSFRPSLSHFKSILLCKYLGCISRFRIPIKAVAYLYATRKDTSSIKYITNQELLALKIFDRSYY